MRIFQDIKIFQFLLYYYSANSTTDNHQTVEFALFSPIKLATSKARAFLEIDLYLPMYISYTAHLYI